MKTPEEWEKFLFDPMNAAMTHLERIEAIQRDALNSPPEKKIVFPSNPVDRDCFTCSGTGEVFYYKGSVHQWILQPELNTIEKLELEVRRLNHNIEVYKERWHQARRYLRAANKGAERNNMVMRLQAADIARLLERIKQLEQPNR